MMIEIAPCKFLDFDKDFIDCTLMTCPQPYSNVKYWRRDEVPYEGAARKVQFCKKRGRIDGIFQCYTNELGCYEKLVLNE